MTTSPNEKATSEDVAFNWWGKRDLNPRPQDYEYCSKNFIKVYINQRLKNNDFSAKTDSQILFLAVFLG